MQKAITATFTITEAQQNQRLDAALAQLMPEYSRSVLKHWIEQAMVRLDNQVCKPKTKLSVGQVIQVEAFPSTVTEDKPEAIPLTILYEDDALLVVNKPAGLVVHPAAGHASGTLVNALLHHCPSLQTLPRAGIVHRLDKDTTGAMVVAKTLPAHAKLVDALQARTIQRHYLALVYGELIAGSTIDAPIGRHPSQRLKMAVVRNGKPATTHIRIQQRYTGFTLLDVKLDTGRTHQIRVHLNHQGYPIVGDPLYGNGRHRIPKHLSEQQRSDLASFERQALHARTLAFNHPLKDEHICVQAEMPDDLQHLLGTLA